MIDFDIFSQAILSPSPTSSTDSSVISDRHKLKRLKSKNHNECNSQDDEAINYLFDGAGTLTWRKIGFVGLVNDDRYEGDFVLGKKEGLGVETTYETKSDGTFMNDFPATVVKTIGNGEKFDLVYAPNTRNIVLSKKVY